MKVKYKVTTCFGEAEDGEAEDGEAEDGEAEDGEILDGYLLNQEGDKGLMYHPPTPGKSYECGSFELVVKRRKYWVSSNNNSYSNTGKLGIDFKEFLITFVYKCNKDDKKFIKPSKQDKLAKLEKRIKSLEDRARFIL